MLTETKRPLLIPTLDKTPMQARDEHFRNFPPRTVGDLPGYDPSAIALEESRRQAEKVKAIRGKERSIIFRKITGYLGALVAAGTLGLAITEAAHFMGNEEHAPWAHKNTPVHVQNK